MYTGYDTKIMRNDQKQRSKISQIEQKTNKLIFLIVFFQFVLCLILSLCNSFFYREKTLNYLQLVFKSRVSGQFSTLSTISYFTYMLLLNTMIPISLIVSLEFVRIFQAYFLSQDEDLFKNNHFLKINTLSINEELGMIQYIFTDKTGTLTANNMQFKHMVIGQNSYSNPLPSFSLAPNMHLTFP